MKSIIHQRFQHKPKLRRNSCFVHNFFDLCRRQHIRCPSFQCVQFCSHCVRSGASPNLVFQPPLDLPWGLNKGHPTTVRSLPAKHSNRKGKSSARTSFVKSLIKEVAGFAPYERRVRELIRNSKVSVFTNFAVVTMGSAESTGYEFE